MVEPIRQNLLVCRTTTQRRAHGNSPSKPRRSFDGGAARVGQHGSPLFAEDTRTAPYEKQPRLGPKEDEELQRQIEANEGIFEPLLVEPHPDLPRKFRIIDGDRRWSNSQVLVSQGRT